MNFYETASQIDWEPTLSRNAFISVDNFFSSYQVLMRTRVSQALRDAFISGLKQAQEIIHESVIEHYEDGSPSRWLECTKTPYQLIKEIDEYIKMMKEVE